MYHHYNTNYEYRIIILNRVNELIYTLTILYRHLVSPLCYKLDCVASTGLALEMFSPICRVSDFSTTITTVTIESIESSDDDWDDDDDDDDLLDDDDDDEVEPDDKDLEDEDQDDIDDDDDDDIS